VSDQMGRDKYTRENNVCACPHFAYCLSFGSRFVQWLLGWQWVEVVGCSFFG